MDTLWSNEDKMVEDYIDVPSWIEEGITASEVAAIIQGGCASGAYMPAVTYATALETMNADSDRILDFICEVYGEVPAPPTDGSWEGMAVFYVSTAVELWASMIEEELETLIEDEKAA